MRIVFAGGGTAGHINPALAAAKYIQQEKPDTEILFIGTKAGMESRLVPKSHFPIRFIEIEGFKRKLSLQNVKRFFKVLKGLWGAERILKDFNPDVVVGTGGYVSGPVVFMASCMHIKTVIHEQNVVPGVTSKMLSKVASKIAISFEESRKYFHNRENIILTGNPLREELFQTTYEKARQRLNVGNEFLIVCFAGSLGAEKINETMVHFIQKIQNQEGIRLVFATGETHYADVRKALQDRGVNLEAVHNVSVESYLYNVSDVYNAADLLVSRSGAITVSEITALKKPSILIPSPNVTNNHQYYNAKILEDNGAAVLIEEQNLNASSLRNTIEKLRRSKTVLPEMANQAGKMGLKNATFDLTNIILNLGKE